MDEYIDEMESHESHCASIHYIDMCLLICLKILVNMGFVWNSSAELM